MDLTRMSPADAQRLVDARFQARKAGLPMPTSLEEIGRTVAPPDAVYPLRITLPWSCLVSDNDRLGVMNGRKIKTVAAREAFERIRTIARASIPDHPPADYPVALDARVWFPRNGTAGDAPNFGKHAHDALEGIVYLNDRWLYDARWRRVGTDIDHPRAELTITRLP